MNKKLFLFIPLCCAFSSVVVAKKIAVPNVEAVKKIDRKIVYVDFSRYFAEKPNAEIIMNLDGKMGRFSPDPSAQTHIFFKDFIIFQADGHKINFAKSGAKVRLDKKNGVWVFRVEGNK